MVLTLNGRTFVEDSQSTEWPDSLENVLGTITYKGDDFARSTGWEEIHFNLDQTNMVRPMFYIDNNSPVFSKDIIRLEQRPYWVKDWFISWLGWEMWQKYIRPGFGFQDGNDSSETDPNTGPFKQQTIDCGCNLHKLGKSFWTRKGLYWDIDSIDFFSRPNSSEINYKLTPHLITKQTLASISTREPVAYITHQKYGDLVWPKLHRYPLMLPDIWLERFPKIPFTTKYLGELVTILGYCFQGSKVYGLFPDGWRVIEEVAISGIGSAYFDRRVYVDEWVKTPPPTIKGWTLGKTEQFDWQLS